MKCPGCNFVCSELRDICPKCISDLRPFKVANGLPVTDTHASFEELVARVRGKTSSPPSINSSSNSLLGGVLSVISKVVVGRASGVSSKNEEAPLSLPEVPPSPPEPPTSSHEPLTPLNTSPSTASYLEATSPPGTSEETREDQTVLQQETLTSQQRVEQHSVEEESVTTLIFTEDLFPSCAGAAGPHSQVFEWVIPAPPREDECALPEEISSSSQPSEEEGTNLHTVSSEIEVEPPTTHSSVFNNSDEEQSILPDAPTEYDEPRVIPTEEISIEDETLENDDLTQKSKYLAETPDVSEILAEQLPQLHIQSPTSYIEELTLTPLPWDGDADLVEEAFGDAFSDIRSLSAGTTIHTDHLFQHSAIDSEQILLHFSLALDELEGRLEVEKVLDVPTSDNRHVETTVIDSALQEVQSFLNKADQPAPLKEFIKETLAEHGSLHQVSAKREHVGLSPRLWATTIDVMTTLFTCLLLTSLLERGGLAELLADLSVNGFRTRHEHWLVASLTLVPCTFILYHFITLPFLHSTVGERIAGLSIRSVNGRPIKARHITSRALSAPLAMVLGGPLFVLIGKPALLDYLSGTDMHHLNSDT